jgi:hypothetical protein
MKKLIYYRIILLSLISYSMATSQINQDVLLQKDGGIKVFSDLGEECQSGGIDCFDQPCYYSYYEKGYSCASNAYFYISQLQSCNLMASASTHISFNPTVIGSFTIREVSREVVKTYDTDGECITSYSNWSEDASFTVTVEEMMWTVESLTGCEDDEDIDLDDYMSVSGVSYSSDCASCINGSSFNITEAGPGLHKVTTTKSYGNGTVDIDITITVNAKTELSFGPLPDLCVNAPSLDLKKFASPLSSGAFLFSGSGVTGTEFNPTSAGTGLHALTFNFTNENGCTSTLTSTVKVANTFFIDAGPNLSTCLNEDDLDLYAEGGFTPSGGVFSGNFVTGNVLDIKATGAGNHIVTYTKNTDGCELSDTKIITIHALPEVEAGSRIEQCADAGQVNLNTPDVAGANGVWSSDNSTVSNAINNAGGLVNINAIPPGSYTLTYTTSNAYGCKNSDSRDLIITGLPDIEGLTVMGDARCGPGTVNLTASYSVSSNKFEWYAEQISGSPIESGASFSPFISETTDFWVEVVSSSGCHSAERVKVTGKIYEIPDSPSASNVERCGTGTVTMTASGGTNGTIYKWYNNESGGSPLYIGSKFTTTVSSTRIYYVEAVNQQGCSSLERTRVQATVHPIPSQPASTNGSSCGAGEVILSVGGAPAGGEYNWYDDFNGNTIIATGERFITPVLSSSKSYYASIVNQFGCESNRKEVKAIISDIPDPPKGEDVIKCGDGDVTLTVSTPLTDPTINWYYSASGGEPFANGSPLTISLNDNSTYYASVESRQGCESLRHAINITVKEVTPVEMGEDISVCLNTGPYDLSRDLQAGFSVNDGYFEGPGIIEGVFYPDIAGVGMHNIDYVLNGVVDCYTDGRRTITVKDITLNGNQLSLIAEKINLCLNEGTFDLFTLPNLQGGNWHGQGITLNLFDPLQTGPGEFLGTYNMEVNGCQLQTTLTINVLPAPDKPAIEGVKEICSGDSVELRAKGGPVEANYYWFFKGKADPFMQGSTIMLWPSESTTYYVKTDNAFGCFSDPVEVFIRVQLIEADFSPNQTLTSFGDRVDFTTNFSDAKSYYWDFGDNLTSTRQNPSHYYYDSGSFTVSLSLVSKEGCETTIIKKDLITVKNIELDIVLGIDKNDKTGKISAYPVPFNEILNLNLYTNKNCEVAILLIDLAGHIVMNKKAILLQGENNISLSVSDFNLNQGTYLLNLIYDGNTQSIKIIKK